MSFNFYHSYRMSADPDKEPSLKADTQLPFFPLSTNVQIFLATYPPYQPQSTYPLSLQR